LIKPGATPRNRKYVGVVGAAGNGLPSYFKYVYSTFPSLDWSTTVGVTHGNVPSAVLVESGKQMAVPHELVHAFGVKFGLLNEDDHMPTSILTSGAWVSDLSYPLYNDVASFMVADAGLNPTADHWMDSETWTKLYEKMGAPLAKTSEIEGDEWFLSAIVGGNGQIAFNDVYAGLKVGIKEVPGRGQINIDSFDPAGNLLDATSLPVNFSASVERTDGAISKELPFAPLLTGIPDHPDNLSVSVSAMNGVVSTFYPIVETLRTHVRNLPDNAFMGDTGEARNELNSILANVENMLKSKQLYLAGQELGTQFSSSIINKVREDYSGISSREKILEATNSFSSRLFGLSQRFSTVENRILRVLHKNPGLSSGERAEFKISSLISPSNSENELYLTAELNGTAQKVIAKSATLWALTTSPVSVGDSEVTFKLFWQNRRMAKAIQQAIDSYSLEKYNLEKILQEETDPERVEEIQDRIKELDEKILDLRGQLTRGQRQLGEALVFKFSAN
jgi:hypothetical protein